MQYTRVNAVQKIASLLLCALIAVSAGASAENLSVNNVSVATAPLQTQSASTNGMVRVCLSSLGSASSLKLTIVGNYSLSNGTYLSNGESLTVGFSGSTGAITLTRSGTSYNMGQFFALRRHSATGTNGVKIAQARQPSNPYPGDLSFQAVRQSSGSYKLYVVAHVYIEQYLYGVLPYEMGNSAHIEALKAQAVAARTYTVRMMASRASGLYDVVDTTNDQVYNGTPSGYGNCVAAVDATKGIVVTNGSSYTATYYSASNGGQTESIRNIWGSTGYDYLTVKDDPFDYANPNCTVKKATVYADCASASNSASLLSLLKSKAISALQAKGYSATSANTTLTTIKSITPHTPKYASPSRLYTQMDFELAASVNGSAVSTTVTCGIFTELESLLGMSIQSSSNELWSVVKSGNSFSLQARRYGHGMGMSQRGAMYMGTLGYGYAQILGFYYPGCTRVQKNFTNTILGASSDETITVVEDPADIDDDKTSNAVVRLTGSNARLGIRASKDVNGKLLGTIANNSPVTALANDGSWCFVAFGSLKGYVTAGALDITGELPSGIDPETPTDVLCFATVRASDFLNLRASASGSAKVVSTAPTGSVLTVFSKDGSWAHIQFGATVAYASVDFLSFTDDYPSSVEDSGVRTATVTLENGEGYVNLRATASTSGDVLATIAHGTKVQVTRDDGAWCVVKYQGMTGYIISSFLTYGDASEDVVVDDDNDDNDDNDENNEIAASVAVDQAVLYADSTEEAEELAELTKGQSVVVTVKGSVWCETRYNDINGYMLTAHLSFGNDTDDSVMATVATQSGSLNMRQQASAGSPILTCIPRGARVTVTSAGGTWSGVRYGGYAGYVMSVYLRFDNDSDDVDPDVPDAKSATVTTISGSLNLREQPRAGSAILLRIPRGATVAVQERGAEWSGIAYGGTSGFAMSAFLTFSAESDSPSDDPTEETKAYAVVSTGSGALNMRQSAASGSAVISTIPKGMTIPILTKLDAWSQTTYNGLTGYVMNAFLTFMVNAEIDDEETDGTQTTATVNTPSGSLNLRDQPSGKVVGQLPRNATVIVSQRGDAWCLVAYGGQSGYVMTSYLLFQTVSTPTEDEPEESVTALVVTPSGALNLRETASLSAHVIAEIPQRASVTVLQRGDSWCKLSYNGATGYSQTIYLRFEDETASATTAPQPTATPNRDDDIEPEPMDADTNIPAWVFTPSGTLNVRESPDENAAVLSEIPRLEEVTVLQKGESWCKLRYGEVVGYAKTKYISFEQPNDDPADATAAPTTEPTPEPKQSLDNPRMDPTIQRAEGERYALVIPYDGEAYLTMYDACSEASGYVCDVPSDAIVRVLGVGQTWCEIRYEGFTGFCLAESLEWIED